MESYNEKDDTPCAIGAGIPCFSRCGNKIVHFPHFNHPSNEDATRKGFRAFSCYKFMQ